MTTKKIPVGLGSAVRLFMTGCVGISLALSLNFACSSGNGGGYDASCQIYLGCYDKTVGKTMGSMAPTYGPMGTCWEASTANTCRQACVTKLAELKVAYPDAGCQ